MNPVTLFLLMLKSSLFSFNGTGNLPILRADLIPRGWVTEFQFIESLAVGQISPGPSGLWVVSLGYLMDGPRGALLAVVAIMLPPFLVLPLSRMFDRISGHPGVDGFMRGLSIAVVGTFAAILLIMIRGFGVHARSVAYAVVAAGLALWGRIPLVAIIGGAALLGILLR